MYANVSKRKSRKERERERGGKGRRGRAKRYFKKIRFMNIVRRGKIYIIRNVESFVELD